MLLLLFQWSVTVSIKKRLKELCNPLVHSARLIAVHGRRVGGKPVAPLWGVHPTILLGGLRDRLPGWVKGYLNRGE
jgi:hypothetical protein